MSKYHYAYGVTSVATRDMVTVRATLDSLADAGFPKPIVFVDDMERGEKLGAFGNWIRSAWELYIRNPHADRFCIFQDDLEAVHNLREILDSTLIQNTEYLNLYSVESNDRGLENIGWHPVKMKGQGALGLVFNNYTLRVLLASQEMLDHPREIKGTVDIDGTIALAMHRQGIVEKCHSPSLLKHTGLESTIGNIKHPKESHGWSPNITKGLEPSSNVTNLEDSGSRIGFVGYNALTGLGEKSRQITTYLPISTWMIKEHKAYSPSTHQPTCRSMTIAEGDAKGIRDFVSSSDVVLFDESPLYPELISECVSQGKRIVCIPAMEWLPDFDSWPKHVDLFICPTEQCYRMFKDYLPCIYYPWPVDTQRFQFKQRDVCNRFLFCDGQGGYNGRKGCAVLQKALKLWPAMPLAIRTQRPELWHKSIEVLGQVEHNYELYNEGDVLISPHSVDGTGLEHMEAMACGMPVITTNGSPWNEVPAIGRIKATVENRKVGRVVPWYLPDAQCLVDICKDLVGQDILVESKLARSWAESRAFEKSVEQLTYLIRYGNV